MNGMILVVDDDKTYGSGLQKALQMEGYEVVYRTNPIDAISEFVQNPYDIVISDYKMDQMDGASFLKVIKEINKDIKSVILTGYPEEEMEINTINLGINRYLSKDKSMFLLVKYINDLAIKYDKKSDKVTHLKSDSDNIFMDTDKHIVKKGDEEVELTRKEYEVLRLFLENKGKALSREFIAEKLWITEIEEVDLRVIDGHIMRLRTKLKLFCIVSVRGYGYKWEE
ncbi:MAG: response regulator transcription factor [Suipraeoptans sp.]